MKKLAAVFALLALSSQCFAVQPPKEIAEPYQGMLKAIKQLNAKGFAAYLDPSFVSVVPSGKEIKRDAFLAEVGGLFKSGKSAKVDVRYIAVNSTREMVAVTFDLHIIVKDAKGAATGVHELGVDTWKKMGGKWMVVKTVDSLLEIKPITAKPSKAR